MWKVGGIIEELMTALGELIETIFRPGNVATLSMVFGIGYKAGKLLIKKLDKQQDKLIESIDERLGLLESSTVKSHNDLERELLRLQILDGIDSKRLSASEVLYFFDRYKKLGGNSFVQTKVEKYINGDGGTENGGTGSA